MDPGYFKRKREPESEDQNEPRKVLVVEGANEDVQSNSIPRCTSSSSQSGWDYDVFLSFRGKDTRKNFTDHLYSALKRVGIHTFRDEEGLDRGEIISSELLNAIRRSRISIVVFSEDYASSRWCLDELAEIVNCKNNTVLPIFYNVNPSVVRRQSGTFAEAFAKHEERFQTNRVKKWREALTQAADLSGWDLQSLSNGSEARFIKQIVEEVSCKLDPNPNRMDVAKHPIGLGSRVRHIKRLLNLETDDVRIVGIYGMGGIGKTTLAKAVYNELHVTFERSSFLLNVKERSENDLQKQLLEDIMKMNLESVNVDRGRGIGTIQKRISGRKVLVILDDVDDSGILDSIVNKRWLGRGSRIIITTRDDLVLTQLEVDKRYEVEELSTWESLKLFNWHAFKMTYPNPNKDYTELSIDAVAYAKGLPLALEVLGSSLKGRTKDEWKSELDKLRITPHPKIQEVLKVSYDLLGNCEKNIFLDIACFFVDMDEEYVTKILDGCKFYPKSGIPTLIRKSLVTIDYKKKLKMHTLIRDMGRAIVHEQCPENPGKRSRLWFHEDGLHVLCSHLGSETIEGLILNLSGQFTTEAFTKMKNLRLLQINDVDLMGSYEHLSKVLKWLCWHKCPLKSLPQDFQLESLVVLDMQNSNLEQVWETDKIFDNLKVLNLSNSKSLTRSPVFSKDSQLEILILKGCTRLDEVHKSTGLLTKLVLLDLDGCEKLRDLPRSIFNLKSLKTFILSNCSSLEKLPEQLGNMMALTELYTEKTVIKRLPSSLHLLSNLETLSFSGCECLIESPKFSRTSCLQTLILEGCTSLVEIHESIGHLKRLVRLNLRSCKVLRNLPSSICNLESLETLVLEGCYKLEELPEQFGNMTALKVLNARWTAIKQLPSSFILLKNLRDLEFSGCEYLIKSPEFSETSPLNSLSFAYCTSLVEIHESIGHLKFLGSLDLSECKKLKSLPSGISNLKHLQWLLLSDCSELDKLPEQWGNMQALRRLDANGTAIEQLPSSFGDLSNLSCLRLSGPSPNSSNCMSLVSTSKLSSLTELDLSNRNLSEDEFRFEFECLSSLGNLKLSRNNFRNLPSFIGCLPNLKALDLSECTSLQSISLARTVVELKANGCTSLERIDVQRISILKNKSSKHCDVNKCRKWSSAFTLNNCRKLVEIQNLERLRCVPELVMMGSCNNLSSESKKSILQMMCKGRYFNSVLLPGSEIPNGIKHQAMGSSISFRVPPSLDGREIRKVLLCIVYAAKKEALALDDRSWFSWRLCNKSSRDQSNDWYYLMPRVARTEAANFDIFEDHILARVMAWRYSFEKTRTRMKMRSGDEIEVAIDLHKGDETYMCGIDPQIVEVKSSGIHFVLESEIESESESESVSDDDEVFESEEDSRL